jgi:hypothetical protein
VRRKLPKDALAFFQRTGRKGGKIGGKRSLETMTPAERTARAKKAAAASAKVRRAKKAAKKKA